MPLDKSEVEGGKKIIGAWDFSPINVREPNP